MLPNNFSWQIQTQTHSLAAQPEAYLMDIIQRSHPDSVKPSLFLNPCGQRYARPKMRSRTCLSDGWSRKSQKDRREGWKTAGVKKEPQSSRFWVAPGMDLSMLTVLVSLPSALSPSFLKNSEKVLLPRLRQARGIALLVPRENEKVCLHVFYHLGQKMLRAFLKMARVEQNEFRNYESETDAKYFLFLPFSLPRRWTFACQQQQSPLKMKWTGLCLLVSMCARVQGNWTSQNARVACRLFRSKLTRK